MGHVGVFARLKAFGVFFGALSALRGHNNNLCGFWYCK